MLSERRKSENESGKDSEDESGGEVGSEADLGADVKWMEWRARARKKSKKRKSGNVGTNNGFEASEAEEAVVGTNNMEELERK